MINWFTWIFGTIAFGLLLLVSPPNVLFWIVAIISLSLLGMLILLALFWLCLLFLPRLKTAEELGAESWEQYRFDRDWW